MKSPREKIRSSRAFHVSVLGQVCIKCLFPWLGLRERKAAAKQYRGRNPLSQCIDMKCPVSFVCLFRKNGRAVFLQADSLIQ